MTSEDPASPILSVSQLAALLRHAVRSHPLLARVVVQGETSNARVHASGRVYFTLKDEGAQVACILFRGDAESLSFPLRDGMTVVARGEVDVYPPRSQYELVVRSLEPAGVGAFWLAFERTRATLEAEGLFAEERKRPLPTYPERIAVVTSESGAALHDIRTVLARRYAIAEVLLVPCSVQGKDAVASLVRAMYLAGRSGADVVIVARGGGSAEDLAAFNAEPLARAVAACPVPVVSAVGHETDVTIVDFVADRRAPTPSVAAELVAPDVRDLAAFLEGERFALGRALRYRLERYRDRLDAAGRTLRPSALRTRVADLCQRADAAFTALCRASWTALEGSKSRLEKVGATLESVSPLATLARGYAAVVDAKGRVVASVESARPGDAINVLVKDGRLGCEVQEVSRHERRIL